MHILLCMLLRHLRLLCHVFDDERNEPRGKKARSSAAKQRRIWADAMFQIQDEEEANGSCGMLMARSRMPALYLQLKPITANSTAIY